MRGAYCSCCFILRYIKSLKKASFFDKTFQVSPNICSTMTTNVHCGLLGVFILSIILAIIQGYPHRPSGDQRSTKHEFPSQETFTSHRDQRQLPASQARKTQADDHQSRMEEPVLRTRQSLDSDGKIVFPSDLPDNVPAKVTLQPASKCKNSTFCENPSYYPEYYIKEAIKTRQDLHFLSTVDTGPEIGQRIDGLGGDESLCAYEETVVFPKTGQNKDKDWLYIVNTADFPQGVRIEACMTENTACSIIEGFAEGYRTSCKQKYVYRQLAAASANGSVGADLFRFPSSCCCHVKFEGNPLTRLGNGAEKASKQSPAFGSGETGRETGKN